MARLVKIFAHLVSFLGMLIIVVLPINKYSWMEDMAPSDGGLPIDHDVGSRAIVAFLFLLVIIITQGVISLRSGNKLEKRVAAAFILIAVLTWAIKFLYFGSYLVEG